MSYTKDCSYFIASNLLKNDELKDFFSVIAAKLPIASSHIAWDDVKGQTEYSAVDRANLGLKLMELAKSQNIDTKGKCIIIQVDEAFPPLFVGIEDWLLFSNELDFVDTIFCADDYSWLIHWDFYKNLHAVKM